MSDGMRFRSFLIFDGYLILRAAMMLMLLAVWTRLEVVAEESDSQHRKMVLFDGSSMNAWDCREGAWVIDEDNVLTCQMEEVTQKSGKTRLRGMGYLWTRASFQDFVLTLDYKLSKGANSGIFFRADPTDPVQSGFEIQLLDDAGFASTKGMLEAKKRNGSLYDCQAPRLNSARESGQWNRLSLTCQGPNVLIAINGQQVNQVDLSKWKEAGKNPDGTRNKFRTALSELPSVGKIGFQNHGRQVWFRDVRLQVSP